MSTSYPTTQAGIHAYHKYLVLRNFQPSTTSMYCRAVRKFYEFCDQSFQGEPINQDLAQDYPLNRVQNGKSWSTINLDGQLIQQKKISSGTIPTDIDITSFPSGYYHVELYPEENKERVFWGKQVVKKLLIQGH